MNWEFNLHNEIFMTTLLQYYGMPYDQNVELFIYSLAFKILFFGLWAPLQLTSSHLRRLLIILSISHKHIVK